MALIKLTIVNDKSDKQDILLNSNTITYITRIDKRDPSYKDGARSMVNLKQVVLGSDILLVAQDPDYIHRST